MAKQIGLNLILLLLKPFNLLKNKAGGTQSVHKEVRFYKSNLPYIFIFSSSDTLLAKITSPVLTNINNKIRFYRSNRSEGLKQPIISLTF